MRDNWKRFFGDACSMYINMDGMVSIIRSHVSDKPDLTEYTSPQVIHVKLLISGCQACSQRPVTGTQWNKRRKICARYANTRNTPDILMIIESLAWREARR